MHTLDIDEGTPAGPSARIAKPPGPVPMSDTPESLESTLELLQRVREDADPHRVQLA